MTASNGRIGYPVKLGLRERNKLEKSGRIRRAALDLFETKGFDATTTREIAMLADVGIGTVFMYADDKRDLLFLIFNEVLDEVVDQAFAKTDTNISLSEQLTAVFKPFYEALHARAALARLLLRELVFFSKGKQAEQFLANRSRIMAGLERLVRQAMNEGNIRSGEEPEEIASAIFFLYSGEVRLWLSDSDPDVQQGLARLQRTFALLSRGLGKSAL